MKFVVRKPNAFQRQRRRSKPLFLVPLGTVKARNSNQKIEARNIHFGAQKNERFKFLSLSRSFVVLIFNFYRELEPDCFKQRSKR